jgi:hypothetical protein
MLTKTEKPFSDVSGQSSNFFDDSEIAFYKQELIKLFINNGLLDANTIIENSNKLLKWINDIKIKPKSYPGVID